MAVGMIRRMGATEWLLLTGLSVIWGGSFFFNKVALRGLPPLVVVWGRVAIGCLGLLVVLGASGLPLRGHLSRWREFLVMGVLNTFLPFSLIVWGQQHIDSGLASIINATTPAFTILLASFLTTDEGASAGKFAGAVIGLGGVATLIGVDALSGLGGSSLYHVLGQAAVMGAAMSYACSAIYGRRLHGVPPLVAAAGQLTGSLAVMTPVVLVLYRPWTLPLPGLDVLGAVAGLGLVCSALAYVIFFRILGSAGATNVQLVTLFIPFSATTLGILALGEPFSWRLVAGMVIVSTAVALIDGRPAAWLRRQRKTPASRN
jgi:drug/metabolite transporter (DMT)-like permease